MSDTDTAALAYRAAATASEIADAMFIYQTSPEARDGLLTKTEPLVKRLTVEFRRLAIAYRMAEFDAALAEISQKEQPK